MWLLLRFSNSKKMLPTGCTLVWTCQSQFAMFWGLLFFFKEEITCTCVIYGVVHPQVKLNSWFEHFYICHTECIVKNEKCVRKMCQSAAVIFSTDKYEGGMRELTIDGEGHIDLKKVLNERLKDCQSRSTSTEPLYYLNHPSKPYSVTPFEISVR